MGAVGGERALDALGRLTQGGIVLVLAACGGGDADPGLRDASSSPVDARPGAADAQPACTATEAPPLDDVWNVLDRDVLVHVPASYDPTARTPVVINVHGLSSDGEDQAELSHMIAKSDAEGFIAVHPDGTGNPRGWNGGDCCGEAASDDVDEAAFFTTLLDDLEAELCVDRDRIHVVGFSNGGFLAQRLACEMADRIASIVAVAGVLGIDECTPARPIAVMQVHGTSDFIVPYGGGGFNGNISAEQSIEGWETRNGCEGDATEVYDEGDATCVKRGTCDGGTDVVLCTIQGGGHQWPGGENIGDLNGELSDDLITTDAAWEFFVAHPMP